MLVWSEPLLELLSVISFCQDLLKNPFLNNGIIVSQTPPSALYHPLLHYRLHPQAISMDDVHITAKLIPWGLL